jgi:hypothetical protein
MNRGSGGKLNVRPIFFGSAPEFDAMPASCLYQKFRESLQDNVPAEVNLLETIVIENRDERAGKKEILEVMAENIQEADIFILSPGSLCEELAVEFARRYSKPVAVWPLSLLSGRTSSA